MTTKREILADLQHLIWSRWMRWMFQQGTFSTDGSWAMSAAYANALQRQTNTPYADLTEHEKDGDREIADEIIVVLDKAEVTQ